MGIGERIKIVRRGVPQKDFAKDIGIAQNTLGNYERGERTPNADFIVDLADKFGLSYEWLLTGLGPMRRRSEGTVDDEPRQCPLAAGGEDCDLTMVPKVKARLSAGSGSLETSDEIDGRYGFRASWLHSKGRAGRMVLMDVTGDSMEPDIRDRDMVLIDQSQTSVIPGAIYAVGVDDGVLIKYIDMKPGRLVLRSANKEYEPLEINLADESLNVRIIGRVVWWCREAR